MAFSFDNILTQFATFVAKIGTARFVIMTTVMSVTLSEILFYCIGTFVFPEIVKLNAGYYAAFLIPAIITPMLSTLMAVVLIKLKENQDELEKLAYLDALSGVANRRYFMEQIKKEVLRSQRYKTDLCLIFIDIDHFKHINDTHGHDVGDLVIQWISQLCVEHSRELDTFARYGGEEFALLMPQTNFENATHKAEELRALVEKTPFNNDHGPTLSLTVSIGVSEFKEVENFDEKLLIKNADIALYRAKENGRNRVEATD